MSDLMTASAYLEPRTKTTPETVWAVRVFKSGEEMLFLDNRPETLASLYVRFPWLANQARLHMRDYPGPLRLVAMTAEEQAEAKELEDTGHPKIRFSWRKFPGVLD
jgi:hypothetical protein